jgi:hypothetical protein
MSGFGLLPYQGGSAAICQSSGQQPRYNDKLLPLNQNISDPVSIDTV